MSVAVPRSGVVDSPGQMNKGWLRMSDICIVNINGISDISRISDGGGEGIMFNQDSSLKFYFVDAPTADAKFEEIYTLFTVLVVVTDMR